MDELRAAFDPEAFRREGHALVDQLAGYLTKTLDGKGPVHPWLEPEDRLKLWPDPSVRTSTPLQVIQELLEQSQHIHHPGFVGHQMAPPLPLAALADLASSVLNNSSAIYEMGPAGVLIEKRVVDWMNRSLGYGPDSDGFFTSGGTLGNLTALLAARQAKGGEDPWTEGTREPFCFLVSEHAHYSIDRAVKIAGWGEAGVIKIPVDDQFRLSLDALKPAYEKAKSEGKRVIGISASACSTATGSFDPLEGIADFAEARGLWFHVDGAHGASTILSKKYRGLLKGIDRADSIVWDPHKMMMTPALTTAVLFKRGDDSYRTFAQKASYLFQKGAKEEWFNPSQRTLECTKRDFSFRLYLVLRTYGAELFGDYVTRQFDLARSFAAKLRTTKDFEVPVDPQANIVCFRYVGKKNADLDVLHTQVRRKIIEAGKFYLVQTKLPTGVHLRTTLMNPFTTESQLDELVEAIRAEFTRV